MMTSILGLTSVSKYLVPEYPLHLITTVNTLRAISISILGCQSLSHDAPFQNPRWPTGQPEISQTRRPE